MFGCQGHAYAEAGLAQGHLDYFQLADCPHVRAVQCAQQQVLAAGPLEVQGSQQVDTEQVFPADLQESCAVRKGAAPANDQMRPTPCDTLCDRWGRGGGGCAEHGKTCRDCDDSSRHRGGPQVVHISCSQQRRHSQWLSLQRSCSHLCRVFVTERARDIQTDCQRERAGENSTHTHIHTYTHTYIQTWDGCTLRAQVLWSPTLPQPASSFEKRLLVMMRSLVGTLSLLPPPIYISPASSLCRSLLFSLSLSWCPPVFGCISRRVCVCVRVCMRVCH